METVKKLRLDYENRLLVFGLWSDSHCNRFVGGCYFIKRICSISFHCQILEHPVKMTYMFPSLFAGGKEFSIV
jgi:hypothetical protein